MKVLALAVLAAPAVLAVGPYGQCGGKAYTGADKTCVAGYDCTYVSEWYSQCRPTAVRTTTTTTTTRTTTTTTTTRSPLPTGKGLDGRMKAKGRLYWGNILDTNTINNNVVTNILKNEFGQITAENSMKMDTVQPNQGQFNWNGGDAVVNWAQQNGMLIRGHTLVWHSQLPQWVKNINNRNTLTTVIQNHVNTVMTRYRGKIYAWDVVNEVLNEDGSMRQSVYSQVLQEDFIGIAFKAARSADPNTKLYINDYNLDSPTHAKVIGMVDKVKKWKAAGAPIDGVGTQAHFSIANIAQQIEAALVKLASVGGVEVAMTELDIYNAPPADYALAAKACINVPECVGITSWGVRDPDSWIREHNPLMFDASGNKKAAYTAAYNALA